MFTCGQAVIGVISSWLARLHRSVDFALKKVPSNLAAHPNLMQAGQVPHRCGGAYVFDTVQPRTMPRPAMDVAESSHHRRGQPALRQVEADQCQIDPCPGQVGGEGGANQGVNTNNNEVKTSLRVEAEEGEGGVATTLTEGRQVVQCVGRDLIKPRRRKRLSQVDLGGRHDSRLGILVDTGIVVEDSSHDEVKEQSSQAEEGREPETRVEPETVASPDGVCHLLADPDQPNAMRVLGRIGSRRLLVLLDSRATHNFVGNHVDDDLDCITEEQPTLRVLVANAATLTCNRKCTNVELNLQKVPFKVDLLVVPLSSLDVVLGVQWLETLGVISWNFAKMTMSFPKEGGEGQIILQFLDARAWGQPALDVAESSHRRWGQPALRQAEADQGQIDPCSGQVGGADQGVNTNNNEVKTLLRVEAKGGEGGVAMALSEGSQVVQCVARSPQTKKAKAVSLLPV
ncbi:hypothetical protein EJ110_NYTH53843 [Nymphaea thermarum]|nr:hypothetical protein EJ110_NYTH53843 [Nymphaea thermarum]